jgi:hypothetical protein
MDRNRIFWTDEQLQGIKQKIRYGLTDVVAQFMAAVDGQSPPETTRSSIVNQLAIFFDFNTVDDTMMARLPDPIGAIVAKRFRNFIRIHYAHSRGMQALPGSDEYTQKWQQRILESFLRKAG